MEISKDLVIKYLHAQCTAAEEEAVARWLMSSGEHARQAVAWIDELSDQQERTFLRMVLRQDHVLEETVSKIGIKTQADRKRKFVRRGRLLLIRRFVRQHTILIISILMLAFAYFLYHASRIVDVETKYGETKVISLPDGSVVTLNANSSIRYAYGWSGEERRVWLKGEAYFDVHQLENNETFKIFLSNDHIVEVVGTEFNINDLNGNCEILLKSGSIILRLNGEKSSPLPIKMIPGELLELRNGKLLRSKADPWSYTAWVNNEWRFRNTSLQGALEKVKLRYNVSVTIADEKLLAKKASGSISIMSKKADLVLIDISRLFNIKMTKRGEEVIFSE